MFVLEPIFHNTIWGGNRLVSVYGEKAVGLGHLYSVRCKDRNSNVILNGKYKGYRLFDVIGEYPLSIALVDAARDLSIQVHPGGSLAKYESYFFLDTPESGFIYCGIDDMTIQDIRFAIENGAILQHIGRHSIQKEDYVFVEPRTVHALTAGSFVYEIEEGQDKTYRLYDYGRIDENGNVRDLQIKQAVDELDVNLMATVKKYQGSAAISEQTYETQILEGILEIKNYQADYVCLTMLSGRAVIDGIDLKLGMTVVLEPDEKLECLDIKRCILARPLI